MKLFVVFPIFVFLFIASCTVKLAKNELAYSAEDNILNRVAVDSPDTVFIKITEDIVIKKKNPKNFDKIFFKLEVDGKIFPPMVEGVSGHEMFTVVNGELFELSFDNIACLKIKKRSDNFYYVEVYSESGNLRSLSREEDFSGDYSLSTIFCEGELTMKGVMSDIEIGWEGKNFVIYY